MRAAILTFALLTACGEQSTPPPVNETTAEPAQPADQSASRPAAPTAKAFSIEEENELYSATFSWPAEAAAVPDLVKQFTVAMDKAKADLAASAKADREERKKQGFDFHPYETQITYEALGQSARLLSLERGVYSFSGGAHGSTGSGSLLWDRAAAREVSIPELLQPGQSWTGAIRQPFCVLLNREREERRGEPVKPDDIFGGCPKYEELTVLVADEDKNGLFDHIKVVADQYVAGPYVEGPYEIMLPITAAMIERLKPEYRASFEPRPPVK